MPLNPRPTFINSSAHEILQAIRTHLISSNNKKSMTSYHLHSETRIYCEFRENKSQAAKLVQGEAFSNGQFAWFLERSDKNL